MTLLAALFATVALVQAVAWLGAADPARARLGAWLAPLALTALVAALVTRAVPGFWA